MRHMRQSPLVRNVRPSKIPEESTDVILSIKPKYVQSILSGEKQYEFRKAIFKNRTIDRVFIYSSAPVKRIVALFEIGTILEDHPPCSGTQSGNMPASTTTSSSPILPEGRGGMRSGSRTCRNSMSPSIRVFLFPVLCRRSRFVISTLKNA